MAATFNLNGIIDRISQTRSERSETKKILLPTQKALTKQTVKSLQKQSLHS